MVFQGQEGAGRAGRQAPCTALPTGKAENNTRQHPLHPPTCPAQCRGAVRGEEERGERKRGASTVGEGLESSLTQAHFRVCRISEVAHRTTRKLQDSALNGCYKAAAHAGGLRASYTWPDPTAKVHAVHAARSRRTVVPGARKPRLRIRQHVMPWPSGSVLCAT